MVKIITVYFTFIFKYFIFFGIGFYFIIIKQGPAGEGPTVLMKPVWARPTLSSCNRLLSKYKALDLASELWPPLSRYKGDNFKLYNFVL